jgi:hypothetical protein
MKMASVASSWLSPFHTLPLEAAAARRCSMAAVVVASEEDLLFSIAFSKTQKDLLCCHEQP